MRNILDSHLMRALGVVALLLPAGITDLEADGAVQGAGPGPAAAAPIADLASAERRPHRHFVFFNPGSADIDPAAGWVLQRLVEGLAPGARLTLETPAATGPEPVPSTLKDDRVRAVARRLTDLGVPEQRIERRMSTTPAPRLTRVDSLDGVLDRRVDIAVYRPRPLRTADWTKP